MIVYIYLVSHGLALFCLAKIGCTIMDVEDFKGLISLGLVELIFEIPMLIKVYSDVDK